MNDAVLQAAKNLRVALCGFDPAWYDAFDCAVLAEELSSTVKACEGASLLAAARAAEAGAHRARGFVDASSWLAHEGGTTLRQAKEGLEAAGAISSLDATRYALLSGEVSLSQAAEITRAQKELPGSEEELLRLARKGDLTSLRDEVRERRLASVSSEELHHRQLKARHLRHWRDGLGMVRLAGALPPESGVPLVTRLERIAQRLSRQARREGEPEPFEAYAADGLLEMTGMRASASEKSGSGGDGDDERTAGESGTPPTAPSPGPGPRSRPPSTELVIVCDLLAWRRGHAHEGEPCHLVGGGPIPVDLAKELSKDAFLKAVLHNGVTIHTVSHLGRRYTAELRTALDLGPVPSFIGRACVECGRTYGLENDHLDPVANLGPTSYDNIAPRCYPHHKEKTERDRRAGLLGRREQRREPRRAPPERPSGKGPPTRAPPTRAPPTQDPPTQDPPTQDPPTQDPP